MPVNLASSDITPTNQGKMEISGIASGDDRFAYFVTNETVTVFDMALKKFLEEFPIQVINSVNKVFTTIPNQFLIITEELKRSRTNLYVYKAETDLDKSVTVHKLPFGASFRGKYQLMHSEDLERIYILHSPGISIMTWPIYGQGEATTFKVGANVEIEEVIGGFVLNEKSFIFEKNKAGQYTSIFLKAQTVIGRGDCNDDSGTMSRFAEIKFFANTKR
ncbi:hypothetical protein B9Z55_027988 [Caenorhabditis nigoni]|uniref:Uncharacterized protein n=1 Tax=Caenorhabditis nigoni TaxID=1611254 RepID=A0A2G5SE25_9PELO|nr:hypothetical protein B9Z55_027988 [Caenorhabditis nigoni]